MLFEKTILILDTNQWIYLANSQDPENQTFHSQHIVLLKKLHQLIEKNKIILLANHIIYAEWKRNKDVAFSYINKLRAKRDEFVKQLKEMSKYLDKEHIQELSSLESNLESKIEDEIEENRKHIMDVEELLNKAIKFDISDNVRKNVTTWSLAGRAPFINNRNNTADACILFSAIEFVKANGVKIFDLPTQYPNSIFVSYNKKDFSSKDNYKIIHYDLKPLLDSVKMHYARNIVEALKIVDKTILEEEEMIQIAAEMEAYMKEKY
jgi:hypothetical protein